MMAYQSEIAHARWSIFSVTLARLSPFRTAATMPTTYYAPSAEALRIAAAHVDVAAMSSHDIDSATPPLTGRNCRLDFSYISLQLMPRAFSRRSCLAPCRSPIEFRAYAIAAARHERFQQRFLAFILRHWRYHAVSGFSMPFHFPTCQRASRNATMPTRFRPRLSCFRFLSSLSAPTANWSRASAR